MRELKTVKARIAESNRFSHGMTPPPRRSSSMMDALAKGRIGILISWKDRRT
jgi:hypothetical protein